MQAFKNFILTTGGRDSKDLAINAAASSPQSSKVGPFASTNNEAYQSELSRRAHLPVSQRRLPFQYQHSHQAATVPPVQLTDISPAEVTELARASPQSTAAFH